MRWRPPKAVADARLLESPIDKEAVGVIVSSGIGGMGTFEPMIENCLKKGRTHQSFFLFR
jgi:3-oxoacyl-(acyl-carrier-protein) synthase